MKIDLTLLEIVAKISRNWNEYRDDFVNFAHPSWIEMGGEELANHMVSQYINRNDGGCVLEEFWRLDIHQREILIKWLLSKERGCHVEFFELQSKEQENGTDEHSHKALQSHLKRGSQ